MYQINRENRKLCVEKVIAYPFGYPVVDNNFLDASRAVFEDMANGVAKLEDRGDTAILKLHIKSASGAANAIA